MFKKMFALGSVTALVGLVATVAAAGCSSTTNGATETPETGPGIGDAKSEKTPVEAGPEPDAAGPPEEGTVGKLCKDTKECNVAGTKNDNVCSIGGFASGDLYGSPVCIQPKCTQGTGMMLTDLECDNQAGLCIVSGGSKSGVCLPLCGFDSTSVTAKCAGGNKCAIRYLTTGTPTKGVGYCEASCQADADCQGTPGQKCQVETGFCLNMDKIVPFGKKYGEGCDGTKTAPADCNCNIVGGTSANKDKGICTRQCLTGAAGNAACDAAVTGWKCTAKLPIKDAMGKAEFTAQVDDIQGQCALPCTDDTTCAALQTATGAPMKCKDFAPAAGGPAKFCETTEM